MRQRFRLPFAAFLAGCAALAGYASQVEANELKEIVNYIQATPRVATSGQPTEAQFSAIAESGYEVVINLAMPDSDNALEDEAAVTSALGMTYAPIPVPWDAPQRAHLAEFAETMRRHADKKVWVHCAMNYRVSAFMYHYLQHVEGRSAAEARNHIIEQWEPHLDDAWRAIIEMDSEALFAD